MPPIPPLIRTAMDIGKYKQGHENYPSPATTTRRESGVVAAANSAREESCHRRLTAVSIFAAFLPGATLDMSVEHYVAPKVRNHHRSMAVRIELDQTLRRANLPKDGDEVQSPLFQGRLRSFLESCVELVVHEQIAKAVLENAESEICDRVAHKQVCCENITELEDDIEALRLCRSDVEVERARTVESTSRGSHLGPAGPGPCIPSSYSEPTLPKVRCPPRRKSADVYHAAEADPGRRAATLVLSAISTIFFRTTAYSAFDGPPSLRESFVRPTASRTSIVSSGSYGNESHMIESIKLYDESIRAEKAALLQKSLGEHLCLPGVYIDRNTTIEQALEDAKFMNKLDDSPAEHQPDSLQMIDRLLRLVASIEKDIFTLQRDLKLQRSDLDLKILRMDWHCRGSGRLGRNLRSLQTKIKQQQTESWVRLLQTALEEQIGGGTGPALDLAAGRNLRHGVGQPPVVDSEENDMQENDDGEGEERKRLDSNIIAEEIAHMKVM